VVYGAIYVVFYAVLYSLEYSGILYILCIPILVSMASLLTSYQYVIHAKHSLYWGRRGPAPHPFLVNISFS
jgi:hypothetical protein